MTETLLSRALRRIFAGGGAVGLLSVGFPLLAAPPALAQEVAPKPVARVEITDRKSVV